jgi:hypothetical protein
MVFVDAVVRNHVRNIADGVLTLGRNAPTVLEIQANFLFNQADEQLMYRRTGADAIVTSRRHRHL